MRSHTGVAGKMFEVLAREGVNIGMISTSEIKISVVIELAKGEQATRALPSTKNTVLPEIICRSIERDRSTPQS